MQIISSNDFGAMSDVSICKQNIAIHRYIIKHIYHNLFLSSCTSRDLIHKICPTSPFTLYYLYKFVAHTVFKVK